MPNYDELAKKYGGSQKVDLDSLAQKYGGSVSVASPTSSAIGDIRSQLSPTQEEHPLDRSFARKVGDFFTGSTQKFAETLGAAGAVATGATKKIDEAKMKESEAGFELSKQLRGASPEQAERIKSQLGQGTNLGTATETIPALNKSAEQVFGEGLGTGLEALSGGTLGKVSKAKTLGQATVAGAKTGGIYGLLSGTSGAMQRGEDVQGVLKDAAIGGATGAALGGAVGAAGYGISKIPQALDKKSEDIYRKILKMSASETAKETAQGKNTPKLLKELGLTGNVEEMRDEMTKILDAKEEGLTGLLSERAKAGATVGTDDFEKAALSSLDEYKTHVAEYGNIKQKVETIIANTRQLFGDRIPVDVANQIKRGLWKDSFNRAGTEVVNDAVYEAGSAMKKLIEGAVPDKDIAGMNEEIGKFIVASRQLQKSVGRPQTGKMSRWLGSILGATLAAGGGPMASFGGAAAGSQVDKVLSSPTLRSGLAQLMAKSEGATPEVQNTIASEVKDILLRHLLMGAGEKVPELLNE